MLLLAFINPWPRGLSAVPSNFTDRAFLEIATSPRLQRVQGWRAHRRRDKNLLRDWGRSGPLWHPSVLRAMPQPNFHIRNWTVYISKASCNRQLIYSAISRTGIPATVRRVQFPRSRAKSKDWNTGAATVQMCSWHLARTGTYQGAPSPPSADKGMLTWPHSGTPHD